MNDRPTESCYVSTATSLQRPSTDFGLAKVLCLGLARQIDEQRNSLAYSANLVERQSDQLTRLLAENNQLRNQLEDLQRLADQRGNAIAGLLQQQSPAAPEQDEQQSVWVEQVMEQAKVFASAWSLVGGPFDTGNGLEQAEEEKELLRALLGGKA